LYGLHRVRSQKSAAARLERAGLQMADRRASARVRQPAIRSGEELDRSFGPPPLN